MGFVSMRLILCLIASFMFTSASLASDFYTDAGITANAIDVGAVTYRPYTLRAKLGYFIAPYYSVETHIATHVYKSEKENQQYKVRNLTGLFLRYGTPMTSKFRIYLAAGYTYTTLDITNARGNYFENHKGFSYSVGVEENLKWYKPLSVSLEYSNYIDDKSKNFVMTGVTVGIRAALF